MMRRYLTGTLALIGPGIVVFSIGLTSAMMMAQSGCLQSPPTCGPGAASALDAGVSIALSVLAVGVAILVSAFLVWFLGRRKIGGHKSKPVAVTVAQSTRPGTSALRADWSRRQTAMVYGFATVFVCVGLATAFFTPQLFLVQYVFVLPEPIVEQGPNNSIFEGDHFICTTSTPGTSGGLPTCANAVFIGQPFAMTLNVADLSLTGCNVTSITLGNGFSLLSTVPALPVPISPANSTTGISTGTDLTLEIRAPSQAGSFFSVGGTLALSCT